MARLLGLVMPAGVERSLKCEVCQEDLETDCTGGLLKLLQQHRQFTQR
jgi:hypothetical protein